MGDIRGGKDLPAPANRVEDAQERDSCVSDRCRTRHQFVRACKNIDGTYIQISASSDQRINVMEIWKTQGETEKVLDGQEGGSALAAKIQDLHLFFSLLVPDMSYEEKQLLDEAMVAAYREKGIGRDNRSLYLEGTREYKEMPVLGDLHRHLLKRKRDHQDCEYLKPDGGRVRSRV